MSANPGKLLGPFVMFKHDEDIHIIDSRLRPVVIDNYAFDEGEAEENERMQWVCDALNEAWNKHKNESGTENISPPWIFTGSPKPIVVSPWHQKAADLYALAVSLRNHAQQAQDRYAVDASALLEVAEQVLKDTESITLPQPVVATNGEWQTIDTAPMDRVLLLGYKNGSGNWRTVRGEYFSAQHILDNWEDIDGQNDAAEREGWYEVSEECEDIPNCWPIEPTHWMYLPKPPPEI